MATESLVRQLNHFRALGLNSVPVMEGEWAGYEAATQSWKATSPLKTSSGRLQIAAEDDVSGVIGFATKDATGTTDARVPFIPAVPGIQFEATLEDGSVGDHALAKTDLYVKYGLAKTTGGLWYLDFAETSNAAAIIIGLVDPIGTVQGRVVAQLLDTVTIYND